MKIYSIEQRTTYWGPEYRYVSLYNGARGTWTSKDGAITEGESHKRIVEAIIGGKP